MVLIAVGTRPNVQLAKEAGLACGMGITVNEYGQTTDPDIYAGGVAPTLNTYKPSMASPFMFPWDPPPTRWGESLPTILAG